MEYNDEQCGKEKNTENTSYKKSWQAWINGAGKKT